MRFSQDLRSVMSRTTAVKRGGRGAMPISDSASSSGKIEPSLRRPVTSRRPPMSGCSQVAGRSSAAGRFVEGELDGELAQVQSARVLDAVAEQALSGEVEALDAAVGGDHDDGLGGVVQDRLELLLALAQGLGGAARLGDVACDSGDAHHAPGLVAQCRQAHRHRDLAAVAMMADNLEGSDALAVEQALRQRPRLLGRRCWE